MQTQTILAHKHVRNNLNDDRRRPRLTFHESRDERIHTTAAACPAAHGHVYTQNVFIIRQTEQLQQQQLPHITFIYI